MKEIIGNDIMNIIVQAILSMVGVFATAIMTIGVRYLNKKKEELINKMGMDNYNHTYNVAKSTFFAIEQNFTGLSGMAEQKRKMFDSVLLQRMPKLTQQELDHFRDGIAGELNHQLKQSQLLAPAVAKVETPSATQSITNSGAEVVNEPIVPKEITESPVDVGQINAGATGVDSDTTTTVKQ